MNSITISGEVAMACPRLNVAAISCDVLNSESDEQLWKEIATFENAFRSTFHIEDVNKRTAISATRQAYKVLGKDPNRYRPSAESLCRRVLRNLPLYKINTLVDLINLVSLKTGYSIGGFDRDKIDGELVLGVGLAGEVFHGIGRGLLNIEGLPVYRDRKGGIGTPTSDEERTKISLHTSGLLMIINSYPGKDGLPDAVDYSVELLKRYTSVQNIEISYIESRNGAKTSLTTV